MIEGALILIGGMVIGRFARWRRGPRAPKPQQPICGCTHHFALHDEQGCHAAVKVATSWAPDDYGHIRAIAWENKPCACRKYIFKDDTYAGVLGP